MSIQIYEWDEMSNLSLDEKNEILQKLTDKDKLTKEEERYLEQLQNHLEDEFWECESCHIYFYKDAKDLRYDPTRCDQCIEEDVTVFGISYYKADRETRKWMKEVMEKERSIDNGLGYYGL